jgi:hypothetical protein
MNRDIIQIIMHKFSSSLLIICLISSACATAKLEKVEILPASSYRYSCSKSGIIIAADPLIDKNRLDGIFRYDLPSKGILPVLIIFENKNADDGLVLLKGQSMLLMKDQGRQGAISSPIGNVLGMDEREKSKKVSPLLQATSRAIGGGAGAAAAIYLPAGAALGAFGALAILVGMLDKPVLPITKQSMIDNEFLDKTVYPGCSQRGFLYFKLAKVEDINHLEGLILSVKNVRSNEVQSIKIEIK